MEEMRDGMRIVSSGIVTFGAKDGMVQKKVLQGEAWPQEDIFDREGPSVNVNPSAEQIEKLGVV